MGQPLEKIPAAAKAGLAYAVGFPSPASEAADFIAMLKLVPNWNEDELAEVYRLVIQGIAERAHRQRFLDDDIK